MNQINKTMAARTPTFPDGFIEQVFAEMQFNIEEILNEASVRWPDMPTCPSQKHRTIAALNRVNQAINDGLRSENRVPSEVLSKLSRMRRKLEDFLSFHRTVCLLEWRQRNGNLDHA